MLAQLQQLQGLAGVDPIALGSRRKDFLEAGQLEIVDVEEQSASLRDQAVERPRVAAVALHGDGNRKGVVLGLRLDP
jgi:hypothetical protein